VQRDSYKLIDLASLCALFQVSAELFFAMLI
jgi:hypothetical protein